MQSARAAARADRERMQTALYHAGMRMMDEIELYMLAKTEAETVLLSGMAEDKIRVD